MADILKRSMAPIPDSAWAEIDAQAGRILRGNLSARKLVDFEGPLGLEAAGVGLGRVTPVEDGIPEGIRCGLRQFLPLVEVRVPFELSLTELEDVARGSRAPELAALDRAARQAAIFEESAVYQGLEAACIKGILPASELEAVPMAESAEQFVEVADAAVVSLQQNGIEGPYSLAVGTGPWRLLSTGDRRGYPLRRRVQEMIGGDIVWSPVLTDGVLVSRRGGDFLMTVGQDLSVGYQTHQAEHITLFLTETFTFQIFDPGAAVVLGNR